MKRSKELERLRFFLKRREGTSAAQTIDGPPLKIKNELQMTDESMNLDDLDKEDWKTGLLNTVSKLTLIFQTKR